MLIPTLNVVVLRCPSCGRLEYRGLSFFSFSGEHSWQAVCTCGTTLLTVSRKKGSLFTLQYHCGMCDCFHINHYHRRELWSRDLIILNCRETDLEVGFIGPRDRVQRAVQHHDRALVEAARDLGFNDYLRKADIMYQVLNTVYRLAEAGAINCGCGNDNIEVEIFPGHLQLRCQSCQAEVSLPAATPDDLERAAGLNEIRLPGHLARENETTPKPRYRRRKSPV